MKNKYKIIIIISLLLAVSAGFLVYYNYFNQKFSKIELERPEIPVWRLNRNISNKNYTHYVDEHDIKKVTQSFNEKYNKYYTKYMEYTAPNGKSVYILAMDKVSDDQIIYAYQILSFYLTSNDNINKDPIANRMADNGAILIMPNGADKDGKTPQEALSIGQNLNQLEVANIGSNWYVNNNYEHRDASFEEIFHMVHDLGVGTSKNPQASSETSKMIADAKNVALPSNKSEWGSKGLWGYKSKKWLNELEKEGSLEQEYVASVIDSYYGLWEQWSEGNGGMWGIYTAKSRAEIKDKDPKGYEVMKWFLSDKINQMMRVDSGFEGTFDLNKNNDLKYTSKSQYLQNVSLSGVKNSNITGNGYDNTFMGNSGTNIIDGGNGYDIIQLRGSIKEYTMSNSGGSDEYLIKDSVDGRDGTIKIKNIELIRATDDDVSVPKAEDY